MAQLLTRFLLGDSRVSLWSTQILLIYFGFVGLWFARVAMPGWLWLVPPVLPAGAFILERASTRLLHRQAFDVLGYSLITWTLGVACWATLVLDHGGGFRWQVSLIVIGTLLSFGLAVIGIEVRLRQRTQTPWGPGGRLDITSGLLDPKRDTLDMARAQNAKPLAAALLLVPWVVFLARLFARSSPDQVRLLLLALCLLLLAAFGAWGAGVNLARCAVVWHWETRHGKRIYLKR
jgi:hypothetical protein